MQTISIPSVEDAHFARSFSKKLTSRCIDMLQRTSRAIRPPKSTVPRTNLILLVYSDIDEEILDLVAKGALQAIEGRDFALIPYRLQSGANVGLREFIERNRPTGMVLLPSHCKRDDIIEMCKTKRIHCAQAGFFADDSIPTNGDHAAMAEMVHWLVQQGHHRIGLVGGPEISTTAQERERGYLQGMAGSGPALIVPGDNTFASGVNAAKLLLEISPRPTAIIASNHEMAAGILHAAESANLAVPGDISVASVDHSPTAISARLGLTTMHVPWNSIAQAAIAKATGQLVASPDASKLKPALNIGSSVRKLQSERNAAETHAIPLHPSYEPAVSVDIGAHMCAAE